MDASGDSRSVSVKVIDRVFSVWFLIYFIISSMFFNSLTAITMLLTAPFDPRRRLVHQLSCVWGTHYLYVNPFWRYKIEGREHIDPDKTYVIVANHSSYIDILVLYSLFRNFKFVSKETIFKIPLIGWNMYLNEYVKIKRGNLSSIKEMMGACRDWLKKGASVMMFPEGTRTQNGELLPFRAGGFSLALELGLPIVPVAISGTFEVFPKGRNELRTFHPMRARVLPPLMPEDYAGKPGKMKEDAQKLISDALVQLRAENSIGTTAGAKEELVGAKKD
ncbi:MAG: 1-acyl-sn-glycerol-3-phosphate acyltransferase [Candidatus Melainabacteria bacterium]|nr:1-acyl-sn-glycerol-3-phosphate acyltransferase [Candidatus Melainabacteria bacterium]